MEFDLKREFLYCTSYPLQLLITDITASYHAPVIVTFVSNLIYILQKILKDYVDSLYTAAVAETSVAHQSYMSLLALIINHSVADKIKESSL
jgi:hypothetical protein